MHMKILILKVFSLISLFAPTLALSALLVGIGKVEITPPIGTPSAGYAERKGEGMEGVHDPLLAIALFIDNGEKKIVLCSVDHLGYPYEMVQKIREKVQSHSDLSDSEIYIGSSHTHSGGGGYLNIPVLGEILAGSFDATIADLYIEKTSEAIIQASRSTKKAKIGIGYGNVDNVTTYRGIWPTGISPLTDVAVIKITDLEGTPMAVFFNFPVHPTILKSQNRHFSADFVGYARDHLTSLLGGEVQAIYFNGAQGDILPAISRDEDSYLSCEFFGKALASATQKIWDQIEVSEFLQLSSEKHPYSFAPKPNPFGITLPVASYDSELNLLVLDGKHAFVTIPGELSCIYDYRMKEKGKELGYEHVSIFGLTNDAHGYIILPESWEHKTFESRLSFGGKDYGNLIESKVISLLKSQSPLVPK